MGMENKEKSESQATDYNYIRIALCSGNVSAIEKVSADLVSAAKDQGVKVKGPIRIPTKTIKVTTRQSPCGNGTNTFEHFNMSVFKRLIDLSSENIENARNVTATSLESGVEVEVT